MNEILIDDDCSNTYRRQIALAQFHSTTVFMAYNDKLQPRKISFMSIQNWQCSVQWSIHE